MREPIPATRSLRVFETLNEAWELTKGCKWAIWAPLFSVFGLVFYCLAIAGGALEPFLKPTSGTLTPGNPPPFSGYYAIIGILVLLVFIVFYVGIFSGVLKTTIERARGNPVSVDMGFRSFSRIIPFLLTLICQYIVIGLPLIITGIYMYLNGKPNHEAFLIIIGIQVIYAIILVPFLFLSLLLAVDKTKNPFAAIIGSFKATGHHWFRIIGIILMIFVIFLISYIPAFLGFGLHNSILMSLGKTFIMVVYIWLLPFTLLVNAVIYHKLVD